MKQIISLLLVIALLLMLAACSGDLTKPANGTYKSDDGFLSQTWTFSGENEITLAYGIISTTGTYSIDGEKLSVTSSMLGSETTSGYTITEITKKSFFIDGTKFIKQ